MRNGSVLSANREGSFCCLIIPFPAPFIHRKKSAGTQREGRSPVNGIWTNRDPADIIRLYGRNRPYSRLTENPEEEICGSGLQSDPRCSPR